MAGWSRENLKFIYAPRLARNMVHEDGHLCFDSVIIENFPSYSVSEGNESLGSCCNCRWCLWAPFSHFSPLCLCLFVLSFGFVTGRQ